MGNVRIELNSEGIRELLKSTEISAACEAQAQKMTQATGVKYVADVYVGRNRVNAKGIRRADNDRTNNS